jgi:isopentenyl diphosphate isomerase/L-lactate dehydrogenase-like FMN-dependent dehydrogenase
MKHLDFRLRTPRSLLTVDDYRKAAQGSVPDMVWAFVEGGAEDNVSMRRNREAFQHWALRQHVLAAVERTDTSVDLAGTRLRLPVLLAPTGLAGLVNWAGELAAARAAEAGGTREVISNDASYSLEEVAAGTREPQWFQLYPWGNDRTYVRQTLQRAEKAEYQTLFVTVDVPTAGGRETEQRRGMGYPPLLTPRRILGGARHPRWAYGFLRHRRFSMPNICSGSGVATAARSIEKLYEQFEYRGMSWADLEVIRQTWRGPIFLKGIMDSRDAERAVDAGMNGIVVSNHGGRQLDGTVGSLDALPSIAESVGNRIPILMDGGVRRGSDVIKALCLGATAVMIGRPYLYGLAVNGVAGVTDVLRILRTEIERTMTLMGCSRIGDLDASWLEAACPFMDSPRLEGGCSYGRGRRRAST